MRRIIKSLIIFILIISSPFHIFSFIKFANGISKEYVAEQFNIYNILTINTGIPYNSIVYNLVIFILLSLLLASLFYITVKYSTKLKILSSNGSNNNILYLAIGIIMIFGIIVAINFPFMKSEDNFFNLGILDNELNINEYFPDNNNTVPLNTTQTWHLYLGNNMHKLTNASIVVKIVDRVELLPNSLTSTSSPSPAIWSHSYLLENNETKITPFVWSINKVSIQGNRTYIEEMTINDVTIPLNNINVDTNENPRIVFELYIYDFTNEVYSFQWESNGVKRCSWVQILFPSAPN